MNRLLLSRLVAGLAAVALMVGAGATAQAQSADRTTRADADIYRDGGDRGTTLGDGVDQQQWWNPADWFDRDPAYNYFTDDYYNNRSGRVGFREGTRQSDSAFDRSDNWSSNWNDNWGTDDWSGDFDWNDDNWWE